MNRRIVACIATSALACGLHSGAQAQGAPLPDGVAPLRYRIEFTPDIAARSFHGSVDIDIDVERPTDRIVMNSADLEVASARLQGEAAIPAMAYDAPAQRLSLVFPHPIAAGARTLHLEYRGRIYAQASGLFMLEYQTELGRAQALFTQFENSDARRFVPSWDEPGRKAVFELAATVPVALEAYSNMPVTSAQDLPGGLKRVRFAATPRMSSYLLFFALGDFERVRRTVDGVDVGVVVKRGDTAKAAYALDAAAQALRYYNEYFDFPFPLPKLDIIVGAGVGQFFDAMENWGAIFGFERAILVDPRISTQADRQRVYEVVAHEMAHQWFGDLVTMAWWDDVWLNEGFADWMEKKVADHFHPDWQVQLRALRETEQAMGEDARAGTHPIIVHVGGLQQVSSEFDAITYSKGSAVIRTLESYLGEDAFRAGVRAYVRAHAYGATRTDDLWQALDRNSPRPITRIAHDLTLQAGVPMITEQSARCVGGRSELALSQGLFAIDADSTAARIWHVPVTVAALGGSTARAVVVGAAPTDLSLSGCAPVVLNAGRGAYYRSRYSSAGFAALAARYAELRPLDQAGLLYDSASLAYTGLAPVAEFLELTRRLPADVDPVVASTLVEQMRSMDAACDGLPLQQRYREYARHVLAPLLARVGWDAKPGEGDNVAILRGELLEALGAFEDAEVVAEARRRFEHFRADPASLDAGSRRAVLQVVARQADEATWNDLHELARAAATPLERLEFYQLLGSTEDATLAGKALALALGDEPPATIGPEIVRTVSILHPALAFEFARSHWDALAERIETTARPQFVPDLLFGASDTRLIGELDDFARARIPASARQEVRTVASHIHFLALIRRDRLPDVDRWIRASGS